MKKVSIIAMSLAALVANAEVADKYNFKYAGEGQKSVLPTQVFDDGQKTIFQFRPGQRIPAIFIEEGGSWVHASLIQDGVYHSIPKTSTSFKLKIGYAEANVKYTGMDRGVSTAANSSNSIEKRSYAASAKGDAFIWTEDLEVGEQSVVFAKKTAKVTIASAKNFAVLARKLANAKSIDVYGYSGLDDDSDLGRRRIDAIVNSLTSFGVERAKIKTVVNVHGASDTQGGEVGARIEYSIAKAAAVKKMELPAKVIEQVKADPVSTLGKQLYRIERTDKTILDVISRWGRNSGWQVISVNFPNISLEGSTDQEIAYSTFLDAVEKMKEGLKRKGYKNVDGRAYMDNVIEIGVFDDK